MMFDRAMIFGLVTSIGMLIFVLELVRSRKLKEEYSLLWLATAAALLILSLSRTLLDQLADAVGIFYPPSALFVVALAFLLVILLQFSTVLSRLSQQNKEIAQEVAILRHELQQTQRELSRQQRGDDQHGQQSGNIQG